MTQLVTAAAIPLRKLGKTGVTFAHPLFALSAVVVPAVVEERDAAIEGGAEDTKALALLLLRADVGPTQADGGDDPAIHLAMLHAAEAHGFAFDTLQMP